MRVAIVHHWFVTRGGGERVAECLAALFPGAELFSLVAFPRGTPASLAGRTMHTSYLQKIPFARDFHRHLMPLYPSAAGSLDLRGFDLVISSDSGPVKGVRTDAGATHICYCHSPMRYLYDGYEAYREGMPGVTRALFTAAAGRVRRWDVKAAGRVTAFIANSAYVADRIRRWYGREATVIHPPIDVHRARVRPADEIGDHYLAAGRLVSYKRTELMIEACARLGRKLRIAGAGPQAKRLRRMDAGGVTLLGGLSDEDLWHEYAVCRALLFAADEDFGMVPLEAQACGRPVIAYGVGGALTTVSSGDPRTGVFFPEQTVESIMEGILRFEALDRQNAFAPEAIQGWAQSFATPIFLRAIREFVLGLVPEAAAAMVAEGEIGRLAGAL